MRASVLALGSVLLFACRSGGAADGGSEREGSAGAAPAAVETEPVASVPRGVLRPDQIQAILEASVRVYRVRTDERVAPRAMFDLALGPKAPRPGRLDPFLEVTHGEAGRVTLRSHPPEGKLEPLFAAASAAFEARDYERARALYARALKLDPEYFKTYTYLGNALFFLGRYVDAERAFRRAIELNPLDYQAHLFLGDTLLQLGDVERSKDALTWAFMLNRENGVVSERLRTALAKVRLSIRERRLLPPVRFERSEAGETTIFLDRDRGRHWYALAACLACWTDEPRCRDRAPPDEDPLRLLMHRECLLNHAAAVAAAREENPAVLGSGDRALLAAIEDGFLEAIVFWEVVAPRAPAIMLLLPDEVRRDVVSYIERFVYVSTRLARAETAPAGGAGAMALSP